MNKIRTDNRLINLRWTTYKNNNNNKSNQTFINELPENTIPIKTYKSYQFDFLYFNAETNNLYYYNGINYTVRKFYYDKTYDRYMTKITDTERKTRTIYLNALKKENGFI